ncbi:hypothetical protein DAPPUDRAFT_269007 [Daphnia pulex]|uniref:Replication factor-A protein 1 N-terminal domain-containing protein n=1 Tax=Daphnia pulex TaxID=6669 RepID=E9HYN4_DAPPU|nr:hypothetical protein DAPPUDRAFT_269007 [Daphnia pulex]|eukprot:EFX63147.1 hypothetical protein DAPPUDRAFT_269007 [Daphnia pulex]
MNKGKLESWRDTLSTGAIPGCKAVKGVTDVRYGLVISDGKYSYAYGMLPIHLNHLVEEGQLEVVTIIKLKQFVIVCPSAVSSGGDGKKGYEILLWDIDQD